MICLYQLLKKFQDESKAKAEGNSSRARRLGRICKQYEEAISLHKKGKLSLVLADLPCPPGFGPIPLMAEGSQSAAVPTSGAVKSPGQAKTSPAPQKSTADQQTPQAASKRALSLQEKQVLDLEKRQKQFKSAALAAKNAGDREQAMEYLRKAKGFDSLIEASKSGLPVDFKSLPVAPQAIRGNSTLVDIFFVRLLILNSLGSWI